MRRRRASDRRIFFPWEGKGGLVRLLRVGRVRPVLIALAILGFVVAVAVRERRQAGVRQTRATLLGVRRAVDAFMADNDGGCPPNLGAVVEHGGFKETPRDAWGRPLRLVCPARHEGASYELMSDGPDGKPAGLDRIE